MVSMRSIRGGIRSQVAKQDIFVKFLAVFVLLSWVMVHDAWAGTLNVAFGLQEDAALNAVVPANPQDKTTANTVATTQQKNTDIQTPTAAPVPAGTASVGVDATISDNKQIFNIPLGYSISDRTVIAGNVPLAIVKFPLPNGDAERNFSIGDVSITLKQRFGDEKKLEYQILLTGKLATGNEEKGLGTGAYDLGITGKIIKRLDIHRFTGMLGYTTSQNKPTISGQEITYGDKWAWMAAYDYNIAKLLRIWLSAKVSGEIHQETHINGLPQNDKLTTIDFSPEIRYFFSENRALNFGLNIPVSTKYDVANAESRGVAVNFGFFSLF